VLNVDLKLWFWSSAWRRSIDLADKKQEKAMLQKLDTEHLNRLALADALASMEPRDFDMRRPDRCICGHALRLFGKRLPYFGGWERQLNAGATLLGLSNEQARELFAPAGRLPGAVTMSAVGRPHRP